MKNIISSVFILIVSIELCNCSVITNDTFLNISNVGISVNSYETVRNISKVFITDDDFFSDELINNVIIREIKAFLDNSNGLFFNDTDFEECLNDTKIYLSATTEGQYWAINMVDSTGKIPAGILSGNTYEPGNYYQCLSTDHSLTDAAGGKQYNMAGKYCLMSLQVPLSAAELSNQTNINKSENLETSETSNRNEIVAFIQEGLGLPVGIVVGFCIPSRCSGIQWAQILTEVLRFDVLPYTECRTANDKPWTGIDIAGVVVLIFIGTLMIIGTFFDIYPNKGKSKAGKIVVSFSIITNSRKLFSLSEPSHRLDHIHGIRALSTFWIILGHLYLSFATSSTTSNRVDLILWSGEMKSIFFTSAPIAVETFFTLGGFLVSWTVMQKFYRKGWRAFAKGLPLYYLLRYVRLIVPIVVLMLLYTGLLYHAFDGPLWGSVPATTKANCEKYWWTNLLFIQNFLKSYNVCITQSWYLAADFQLYLFTPLIVFFMLRSKFGAFFLMAVLNVIATVWAYTFSRFKKWPAAAVFNDAILVQERQDLFYIKPWSHTFPYLCGMMLGFALFLRQQKTVQLLKSLVLAGWLVCVASTSLIVFGMKYLSDNYHVYSEWDTVYLILSRVGWTGSLSWIIFCCYYDLAGPIGLILNLKVWRILSRLSFTLYLTHLPLIKLRMYSNPGLIYFTNETLLYNYFGVFCYSFVAAVALTLSTESPIIALLKLCFANVKDTSAENKTNNVESIITNKKELKTKF